MATFSENQVRHLYVATEVKEPTASGAKVGAIKAKFDKSHETIWFEYLGNGGRVASDKIKVANIVSARSRKSTAMDIPLKRYEIKLDSTVNAGNPIAGQDYILRVAFREYIGISQEDQYFKFGMVHAVKGMTADTFYKTLAISLAKNIARDQNKLVKILAHSASITSSTGTNAAFDSDGFVEVKDYFTVTDTRSDKNNVWYNGSNGSATDIDYIVLEEVEQDWVLGKISVGKIPFEVQPDTVLLEGDELIWGVVTELTSKNKIGNGKIIADLEYFCMGERGDIYRGVGYPNNIETKYLVDPTHNYDVLDIAYFYAGNAEDIQKSPKVITIVADNAGSNTIMKAVVADVNAATANKPVAIANPD